MNATQQKLYDALQVAAPGNVTAQLGLIYVYANRERASEKDVRVVRRAIIGGPVVECAG